jgi:uncharacterized protein (DUF305 family)
MAGRAEGWQDPEMKKMAKAIIAGPEKEIATFDKFLAVTINLARPQP